MKKIVRSVVLSTATLAVAVGLVAVAPAPSNAGTNWGCPGCRVVMDDSDRSAAFNGF